MKKWKTEQPFFRLIATNFLFWLSAYLYIPVLPPFLQAQGFSGTEIGLAVGGFSVGALLLRVAAGRAADYWGSGRVAGAGLLLTALVVSSYGTLAAWIWPLLFLRVLHGVSGALYSSAAISMVTFLRSSEQMKQGVALHTLCSMIGIGLATALGLQFYERCGFNAVVMLSAAAVWCGVVLLPRRVQETTVAKAVAAPLADVLHDSQIRLAAAIQFGVYLAYGAVMTCLPLLGAAVHGGEGLALFYGCYAVTVVAARVLAGRQRTTEAERKLVLGLLGGLAVSLPLPQLYWNGLTLLLLALALGAAVGVATPLLAGLTAQRAGAANRGTALGFFATAIDLGMLGGAAALGAIAERFGYAAAFGLAATLTAVLFVLTVSCWEQRETVQCVAQQHD